MESKVAKNTYNCRDLNVSLLGNFTAIKQLLQQHLFAALCLSQPNTTVANLPGGNQLTPEMIPLHRLSNDTGVLYRCAIALKLAPLWQMSAIDIANQLLASLAIGSKAAGELGDRGDLSGDLFVSGGTSQMYLDFSAKVVLPGWIDFELSDRGLAVWLQQMIEIPVSRGAGGLDTHLQEAANLFLAQYAHARCCSLLRLADSQGLIKLENLDFKLVGGQFVEPNPIPWLDDYQETDTKTVPLRLLHPAERRLIVQLLDVQDEINSSGPLKLIKLSSALSKAFETFDRDCRIWGDVKTHAPKLAQARLGLVAVTQISLRSLLQNQLGVPAPIEL